MNTKKQRVLDTPIKLKQFYEFSTDENSQNNQAILSSKSLFGYLHKIKNVKKKTQNLKTKDQHYISDFSDLLQQCLHQQEKNYKPNNNEQPQIKQQDPTESLHLTRTLTTIQNIDLKNQEFQQLNLYKSNSTFQTKDQIEEIKYGDNVYIKQIMALRKTSSKGKVQTNQNTTQNNSNEERLTQDYQINNKIQSSSKNQQRYICLNKLQRIFYYVKKIIFSTQHPEQEVLDLAHLQIALYNRDQKLYFLRLYQSWIQAQAIYMIFQVASGSLLDKNYSGIRLREHEIWLMLKNCANGLSYLYSQGCAHLNIKPGNILKCRETYKLADPFCKHYKAIDSQNMTNARYWAPEIIAFWNYLSGLNFEKCDVYSLGICILQNLIGAQIFFMNSKQIQLVISRNLKGFTLTLKKFLLRMVSTKPNKRPQLNEFSERNIETYQEITKQKIERTSSCSF